MGFDRLLAHDIGKILLVNLAETYEADILPVDLRKAALQEIEAALAALKANPTVADVSSAFGRALLRTKLQAAKHQVKGIEAPDPQTVIAAVVSFDKVRDLLSVIWQRMPSHRGAIEAMIAPDAPDRTVEKVAQLLNDVAPLASDLVLSNWPTIFWAAPLKEMERLVASCSTTVSGAASPSRLARFIRDALGLIHLDYDLLHPDRHLFMFTARESLDAIAPVHALQVARPTTLDGWGNRRFCQALMPPAPLEPGCGMTIDIADGGVAVGAAEIVCTPVPMLHFECSYVGPVDRSDFGPDSDYLSFIRRGRDLQDLADYLTAEAA